MQNIIDHPRLVPCLILVACVLILGTAYASEVLGGLKPCVLCIYQRYAYGLAGLWGALGMVFGHRVALRRLFVAFAGISFLIGAGLAVFHVGVEQLWWEGTAGCHAPALDATLSLDEMREQLLATDFVACDEIAWSLFGISMAGYNVLVSGALGLASLWAATQIKGRQVA